MSRPRPDVAIFLLWVGPGGKETVMWNLARAFLARGLRVDVVLGVAGTGHEHRIPPGARVVHLRAIGYLRATVRLALYLVRARPRSLLATLPFAAIPAVLAARLAPVRTRVVLRVCNNLSMRVERESASFPRHVLFLLRRLPRLAHAVVACSAGVARSAAQLLGLDPGDLVVIGNPVTLPEAGGPREERIDRWIDQGGGDLIVTAGRLAPQKNFPMLIRALSEVRRVGDARLLVLGEGPERPALERLVREEGLEGHVLLPGRIEDPFPYLARCRVFALSSSWEGFANVVLEAMAAGAPVVATDCPSGPAEILDGGRYGHLVPVDDPGAMAAAILAVLGGERREIPDGWLRQFAAEEVARRYLALLGSCPPASAAAGGGIA